MTTPLDAAALAAHLRGCDALIVTLGPAGTRPATVMRDMLPVAIDALGRAGVRRIVVLGALGDRATRANAPLVARMLATGRLARDIDVDHDLAEAALPASGLDWTIVHPGRLLGGAATGAPVVRLGPGVRVRGIPRVRRGDVAAALLAAATDPATVGQRLYVGSGVRRS